MKTIMSLAKEMQGQMTKSKRNDDTIYHHLKDGYPEWMTDIVFAVHEDKLPDDTTYRFISEALDIICELEDDTDFDDIHETIYEQIEADIYTSDLTDWLGARNDHVYYLTEALEEMDIKDGFQALAYAQTRHKTEVALDLVSELEKLAEED